ncbi:MAG TPA: ATP-binding cassette domain-containing protein [Mycobacteriales bacterium]|nr:ATP-binding cassette domain-containing protein [Mycobacteriales bacterium]
MAKASKAATTQGAAVSVRGLVKRYGPIEAVRGIDLDVTPGEVFGFLGPNGAGKSTTIKMLCTLVVPTAGSAQVAGLDVITQRTAVRRNIGLVFQETTLDEYLTAEQNLKFHASIYGMSRRTVRPRIAAVLDLVGLADRKDSPVRTFSGGMKRRLEIARGLLHSPRVLFLDEPTIGLDPDSRQVLWRYVDELRRQEDITVFLTTHYMDEAERCDRIAIINHGTIVALGTPAELKAQVGDDRVRIVTGDNPASARKIAEKLGIEASPDGDALLVTVPDGEGFVPKLFGIGISVQSVSISRPSLDDVFMAHAGRRIGDEEAAAAPRSQWMRAMSRR